MKYLLIVFYSMNTPPESLTFKTLDSCMQAQVSFTECYIGRAKYIHPAVELNTRFFLPYFIECKKYETK